MSDPQEFVKLFTSHNRRIFSYILTLVPNVNDADEVFQETSRVLWEKFSEYEPDTNFGAWGCRIAQFCALSFHRKNQRHAKLFSPDFMAAIEQATDAKMAQESRDQFLHECMEQLSSSLRQVIQLRYLAGATTRSTAKALEKSPNAIRKLVVRARHDLHECIERKMSTEDES